jgi:hypothetical protein
MSSVFQWITERDRMMGDFLLADTDHMAGDYLNALYVAMAGAFSRVAAEFEDGETQRLLLASAENFESARDEFVDRLLSRRLEVLARWDELLDTESPGDTEAILLREFPIPGEDA